MWILLLRVLISLPSLFSMFKEIIALIKALPKDEQQEARKRAVELAKAAKESKLKGTQSDGEIWQFKEELLARLGRDL